MTRYIVIVRRRLNEKFMVEARIEEMTCTIPFSKNNVELRQLQTIIEAAELALDLPKGAEAELQAPLSAMHMLLSNARAAHPPAS